MFDKELFIKHYEETLRTLYARTFNSCSKFEKYFALARMITDNASKLRSEAETDSKTIARKKVYYFSMEFLIGRLLENYLVNLGIRDEVAQTLSEMGENLEDLLELEPDPGLGNGGLGRLAACFLDSMASLNIQGEGIGLRYKFGLFRQKIIDGKQVEFPDPWLDDGYPWENINPDYNVTVRFGGFVDRKFENGKLHFEHKGYQEVLAVPYDVPIVGEGGNHIGILHLYDARPVHETIDMDAFNRGDYAKSMQERCDIAAMTSILYPDDSNGIGRKLRLRQEYLMVAAGLGSIVKEYVLHYGHDDWKNFPERVSIHINDTHPTLCIPELMRILLDEEHLEWDDAFEITTKTISFTNHTVLPEALEKWSIDMFQSLLPRIYMIVEEIDRRFKESLIKAGFSDAEIRKNTAILWDGEIRMAFLSIIGSHSVNGVAALHTQILKDSVFREFYQLFPERFNNKTNGVSHRRFLVQSNPGLSTLLTKTLGSEWKANIGFLETLISFKNDLQVLESLALVKRENKLRLSEYLKKTQGITINPDSVFDVQVKRIHAYKRQLLNALKVLYLYNQLMENPDLGIHPYTFIFAGKAARGYAFAKDVIRLINTIADLVNNEPKVNKKLQVVFVENFCISNAQLIYPAADISEQISTAGKEASGTGNMKFMMNGAVTLGTLDGANVEIREQVGDDNIFIFGLRSEETEKLYSAGTYHPQDEIEQNPILKKLVTQLVDGTLKDPYGTPLYFWSIFDALTNYGDEYFVLKDFMSYIDTWSALDKTYGDAVKWRQMSLTNIANSAFFSSDRTIKEYAEDIWQLNY